MTQERKEELGIALAYAINNLSPDAIADLLKAAEGVNLTAKEESALRSNTKALGDVLGQCQDTLTYNLWQA